MLWLINTDATAADGYGTKMSARNQLHVRGRRLMMPTWSLQGLAQFRIALAEFSEESHVLDGAAVRLREFRERMNWSTFA